MPMKIGYIMQSGAPDVRSYPLSGPAVHVVRVCDELRRLGHTVTLLMFQADGLWKSCDNRAYERVEVPRMDAGLLRRCEGGVRRIQHDLRLTYINAFDSVRFAAAIGRELAGCDLLYERYGWMGYGGALASRRYGIPLIVEVNGDHLPEFEMYGLAPKGLQRRLSVGIMRWATHQPAFVVSAGEATRKNFVERWSADMARTTVIENGSEVVELLDRSQLRSFQPRAEDEPVRLAYIGSLEPWHGVTNLIQALAKVRACGAEFHLDLIGSGSQAEAVRQAIAELQLASLITLHGYMTVEQFAPLLAQADVGLAPYCGLKEFTGLKLFDYKAAGLAIIASGVNGQPRCLKDGETALLVPPCNVDALAAAIMRLAASPAECRRLGQAARCEAEVQHSWANTAQKLDDVFRQVVCA